MMAHTVPTFVAAPPEVVSQPGSPTPALPVSGSANPASSVPGSAMLELNSSDRSWFTIGDLLNPPADVSDFPDNFETGPELDSEPDSLPADLVHAARAFCAPSNSG